MFSKSSAPHLGEERPAEFLSQLEQGVQGFLPQMDTWRGWIGKDLEFGHVEQTLDGLRLNEKERNQVLESIGDGSTMDLWGYFNVLTALITHDMGSLNRRVQSLGRLHRISSTWR